MTRCRTTVFAYAFVFISSLFSCKYLFLPFPGFNTLNSLLEAFDGLPHRCGDLRVFGGDIGSFLGPGLPFEQAEVLLATSEGAQVHIVLVKELQVEVAKRSRLFEDSVGLMTVATACHDGREIVAGVI